MREYGLTVLVAAAVTYLLTPLVRRFAIAVGAMHAARARDVHTEPVPLVGGLAMYLGLAAALLVASRLTHLSTVFMGTRVASGLLLAGGVVVILGFVDDRWGLGAITKLAGQVVAGVLLVWSGISVGWLPIPGGGTLSLTLDQQTVLTVLLVVVTINAVNFIDGLDGLAAGIVGIGAAAFFLYYYTLTKRLGLDEQTGPALASAILAGVCLGFLPHNFHPARIFMGDTGSMLLGLLLAYVPISSLASLDPNTLTSPSAYSGGTVNRFPEILPLLVPAIIMLIPYADLLLAVVRRTRAGQSPFSADKKHLQHRLLAIGHSHRASVLIMYLWAALFAGTVVLLSIIRTKLLVLGLVTLAGVLILLLASMPRLRPWNRRGQLRLAPNVAGPVPAGVATASGAGAGMASGGRCLRVGRCLRAGRCPRAWCLRVRRCLRPGRGRLATRSRHRSRRLRVPGLRVGVARIPAPAWTAGCPSIRAARATAGLPVDRSCCGPRTGRPCHARPPAEVRGPGTWGPGARGCGVRGSAARRSGARGCGARGSAARRCRVWEPAPRGRPAYGDSRPEGVSAGTGWGARPNGTRWDGKPGGTPWDGKPAGPARPAESAAWDSHPSGAAWDAGSATTPPGTPAPAEAAPGPGSPATPTDGGWAPDPVGSREPGQWYPGRTDPGLTGSGSADQDRQDSGQWYSGRPEPSQRDSGRRDSRPHDAGARRAGLLDPGLEGASVEEAGLPGASLTDPGPQPAGPAAGPAGPQHAGPQHASAQHAGSQEIDPLTPDPARSQPPRPAEARPVHPDANEYSEEEESPLLPWRFH